MTAGGRGRRPDAAARSRLPGGRAAPTGTGTGTRAERRRALARRRARAALVGACAFAVVVLATSLPLHTLLQQRAQTKTTAAAVRHLGAQNRALAAQAAALANPATVRSLAHSELGYVEPGQKAYDVVPPSSPSAGTVHVGQQRLGAPVPVPGSAAAAAAIGLPVPPSASGSGRTAGGAVATSSPGGGFLSRMLHALEFWG